MRRRAFLRAMGAGVATPIAAAFSPGCARGRRIARVEWFVFDPSAGLPSPGSLGVQGTPPAPAPRCYPAVRITAANGAAGGCVGSGALYRDVTPDFASRAAAETSWLCGIDADDPREVWARLIKAGVAPSVLNLVDIALWDLLGHLRGMPLADVLGDRARGRVRYYVSSTPDLGPPGVYAIHAATVQRWGYQGYKIHPYVRFNPTANRWREPGDPAGFPEHDMAVFREVRHRLAAGFSLMVDNCHTYNLAQAMRIGRELDELGCTWLESPMPEQDSWRDAYVSLAEAIRTPICAPESLTGFYQERLEWMRHRALDINRIDVEYGGFTACHALVEACRDAGIPVDLHGIPMSDYHLPLYAVFPESVLPWRERHLPNPDTSIPADPLPFMEHDPGRPWLRRFPDTRADAQGCCHLTYPLPGFGMDYDWEFILDTRIPA